MKKLLMSMIIVCCIVMVTPELLLAQTQSPCYPNTGYYQPNVPPQPSYLQPPSIPYLPPQPQPQYMPVQPQPQQPQWGGTGYWYDPQQLYQCGLQLVYAKRYQEALQVFQQFLRLYPQSSLADNALYWSGECYYAQKQYSTALWYFQCILSQYPRGNKVPDAMLKIALSYFSMKQDAQGCQYLQSLLQRYPKSESARKAYRWLNRCGGGYGGGNSSFPCPPPGVYGGYPYPGYSDPMFPKNY